ncbi:MAG: hypothetical protein Q7S58_07305 [Candidatus Binatus sp.]|uniref:hypothetical protein n=1 Tax=Candidatus Binatus sp. TaxID=2811406 RepID=UPI002716C092|nr:hypothetical protein [Candidatus Binatus sp.]MDO8432202.1 hypothetical protein [Candidatus Binatus sp.]
MLAISDHSGDHSENAVLAALAVKLSAQMKGYSVQSDHFRRDHSAPPITQRVGDEVERPALVDRVRHEHWGSGSHRTFAHGDKVALVGAAMTNATRPVGVQVR